MSYTVSRYHDISCGHRVVGHEGKCRHLHGHNYRIHFHCRAKDLDDLGRVIDFGVIKSRLCMWLEETWDHKFVAWDNDQHIKAILCQLDPVTPLTEDFGNSMVFVPFNPTAENMAKYLVEVIGPKQLKGTPVELFRVDIEETRKCSASFEIGQLIRGDLCQCCE
jgi:6-pyruvoyltetrahydropterin/6-carboxytetrahydropterin synthase